MVNWLVGAAPDRFAAAVSENGVTNQVNGWANSDSGPEYDRMALLGDPFTEEGVAKLWRQSPLRYVARIRTPLLMLQGEADLRCPAADNEQLFIALRHLGREVEYVLYPESWHTFAITGRPDRRIDRNERMLAWFDRFLTVRSGDSGGASAGSALGPLSGWGPASLAGGTGPLLTAGVPPRSAQPRPVAHLDRRRPADRERLRRAVRDPAEALVEGAGRVFASKTQRTASRNPRTARPRVAAAMSARPTPRPCAAGST